MGCVYIATNLINGKSYIGKTVYTLHKRKTDHCFAAKSKAITYFHRALIKYDVKNFIWAILFESKNDKLLIEKEIESIQKYNTEAPNGYNMTKGGDGTAGFHPSEETRKRMSVVLKGNQYAKGNILSQEARQKISLFLKGRKQSEKHIVNRAKTMIHNKNCIGRVISKETKEKMRKSALRRYHGK